MLAIFDIQREIDEVIATFQHKPKAGDFRATIAPRALPPEAPFRLLFLVHTKPIRDTTHAKFAAHYRARGFPSSSFLNIQGAVQPAQIQRAQFIFCLFQSFEKVASALSHTITHVIIDECHHLLAATYQQVYRTLCAVLPFSVHRTNMQHIVRTHLHLSI